MAKLRRKTSDRSAHGTAADRVPMAVLLDRAGRFNLSRSQCAVLSAVQREIDAEFDPREVLSLSIEQLATRDAKRARWIEQTYANDPRVAR